MLLTIDSLLTPDLLYSLAAMGHGDRIGIVDANFPGARCTQRLHRLPGIESGAVLRAVLSVMPLDESVVHPAVTMQDAADRILVPEAVTEFMEILVAHDAPPPVAIERFAFYDLAKSAFAIVQTGELRPYGNIILSKGIVR